MTKATTSKTTKSNRHAPYQKRSNASRKVSYEDSEHKANSSPPSSPNNHGPHFPPKNLSPGQKILQIAQRSQNVKNVVESSHIEETPSNVIHHNSRSEAENFFKNQPGVTNLNNNQIHLKGTIAFIGETVDQFLPKQRRYENKTELILAPLEWASSESESTRKQLFNLLQKETEDRQNIRNLGHTSPYGDQNPKIYSYNLAMLRRNYNIYAGRFQAATNWQQMRS